MIGDSRHSTPSLRGLFAALCLCAWVAMPWPAPAQMLPAVPAPTPENVAVPAPTPAEAVAPKEQDKTSSRKPATFTVDAGIGFVQYQGTVKPEMWYPVWAIVDAKGQDISGRLVFSQDENPLIVEVPVYVAKGSKKLFRTFFKPAAQHSTLAGTIYTKKAEPESFPAPYREASQNEQHILVLAEQTGTFAFLNRRGAENSAETGTLPLPDVSVLYGLPDLLPDDPIALQPLDAIVLTGPQVRALRPEQWAAIVQWVGWGGNLLIGAGRHQPFIQQSCAANPFGVQLADPQPARLASILRGDFTPLTTETLEALGKAPEKGQLLVSWPSLPGGEWGKIWLGDAGHPFLASRQVGEGLVSVCAAALDPETLTALNESDGASGLWPRILERRHAAGILRRVVDDHEGSIGGMLQAAFGVRLVGAAWVFWYLAIYIFLSLPVAWILLSWRKHRGWFWTVAVLLAVAFSSYSYFSGSLSREKEPVLHAITFLSRCGPNESARATTLSSLYTPKRLRADFLVDSPMFAAGSSPESNDPRYRGGGSRDLYSDRPLTMMFGNSVSVQGFSVYPWSARNLREDFTVAVQGGIEVADPLGFVSKAEGKMKGRLVNHTPWTFSQWSITDGADTIWMCETPLEAGAAFDLPSKRFLGAGTEWTQFVSARIGQALEERGPGTPPSPYVGGPARGSIMRFRGSWNAEVSLSELAAQGFRFVGITDTAISPMMETLNIRKTRKYLFYEQRLEESRGSLEATSEPPAKWLARAADEAAQTRLMGNWQVSNIQGGGLPIPATEGVVVLLQPSHAFAPLGDDKAEISLSFEGMERYYGPIRDKSGKQYKLRGLPVSVFNFTTRKWEDAGVWTDTGPLGVPLAGRREDAGVLTDKPYTLGALSHHLDPATSAIALRLNADFDSQVFVPTETKSGEAPAPKTGKELRFNGTPSGGPQASRGPYPGMLPGRPGQWPCIWIKKTEVKIIRRQGADGSTLTTEPPAAKTPPTTGEHQTNPPKPWSGTAAIKQKSVRSRRQRDSTATLFPPCHYSPLVSLRAKRSNLPSPAIRDCFASLAMTQRAFSTRPSCLRRTPPLTHVRRRMRSILAEKTRKYEIVV